MPTLPSHVFFCPPHPPQIGKRLVAAGLANDAETRRGYREVLFAHPQIGEWLAGAILFEETLGQANAEGVPFPQV